MQYLFPCKPNTLCPESPFFEELDRDINWVAEVKKNGWRALPVRDEAGRFTLYTRHNTLINEPAELREALIEMMPERTVLDGEFVNNRTKGVKGKLYLFDIIMLEGRLLVNLPFRERRRILEGLCASRPDCIELAGQVRVGKKNLYYHSIAGEENEGIVVKRLDSKYLVSDRRCLQNPYWLKVKRVESHIMTGGR